MSLLVHNCPRCRAQNMTFDVLAEHILEAKRHGWQRMSEIFCRCRICNQTVVFRTAQLTQLDQITQVFLQASKLSDFTDVLNKVVKIEGYVQLKDFALVANPLHCPPHVDMAFREGATCLAAECFNAAGTMFRLCVDLATRGLLPPEGTEDGPNAKQRRDLGLRLPWLFDKRKLPEALRDLSHCIKEDGNDGAHAGTLKKEDAEDLLDFTRVLLERVYTEPEKLKLAKSRREQRRDSKNPATALPRK